MAPKLFYCIVIATIFLFDQCQSLNCSYYVYNNKQNVSDPVSVECQPDEDVCLSQFLPDSDPTKGNIFIRSCLKSDNPTCINGKNACNKIDGVATSCCCDTDNCNVDTQADKEAQNVKKCYMCADCVDKGILTKCNATDDKIGMYSCVTIINTLTNAIHRTCEARSICKGQPCNQAEEYKTCCCDTDGCNDESQVDDLPAYPTTAAPEPEASVEPEPEENPKTTSEPESTAGPTTNPEPETSTEAESSAQPETSKEPETDAEDKAGAEPETTSKPKTTSKPETENKQESGSEEPNIGTQIGSSPMNLMIAAGCLMFVVFSTVF